MTQYCRYCSSLVTGNGIYCESRNMELGERYTKRPNRCPAFDFNEIDAYDLDRRYRPRRKKTKTDDGQLRLEGI